MGFGLIHALFVLLILTPLLPSVHPRMASERSGPTSRRQLEPPGFFALHYGFRTPLVTIVAHLLYGAVLGSAFQLVVIAGNYPGCRLPENPNHLLVNIWHCK